MKTLADLFAEFPLPLLDGQPDGGPISAVVADSRQVEPGALFVAMTGGSADGHDFIPQAIDRGAAAIVGERPRRGAAVPAGTPYVQVENARQALAWLAAAWHDFPARRLTMIGVTGTDGKTTTSNMLFHMLREAGLRVGMISTVNAVIGDETLDTGFHVTTPDAPAVQAYLARMTAAGLTHAILETTSHGWAQFRTDACEFDVGIVTNITHEHLDYHGSYEAYRAAKARLFTSLAETGPKASGNPRLAVLNRDDGAYAYLAGVTQVRQLSYGLHPAADVRALDVQQDAYRIRYRAQSPDWSVEVVCPLPGRYNVSNSLAALTAAVYGLGLDPQTAVRGLLNLPGVPGRMERINLGQDFTAIVDFAHTPNALRVALETARSMTEGRVIAVFGSAGLRDREKRRMMAEVSAELADVTILTAEDPRTESLEAILEEMAAGARRRGGVEGETFFRVPDRGEAIRQAVRLAAPGDLVIACGKGHEQSMCFGETEYPWDDRIAMRAALAERLGVPGPQMLYLPTSPQKPKTP